MPLHIRSIATGIAVICFFGVAIIGWFSGLSPFSCCKKAVIAALFAYVMGTLAARAINAILINAMVTKQINQQKEKASGGKD